MSKENNTPMRYADVRIAVQNALADYDHPQTGTDEWHEAVNTGSEIIYDADLLDLLRDVHFSQDVDIETADLLAAFRRRVQERMTEIFDA